MVGQKRLAPRCYERTLDFPVCTLSRPALRCAPYLRALVATAPNVSILSGGPDDGKRAIDDRKAWKYNYHERIVLSARLEDALS